MNLKEPEKCISAEEIRNEIDKIDRQIIELFTIRHKYVEEIVRFKNDETGIIAQERKDQVIQLRKKWAEENGLHGETFARMYSILIETNIKHEMEILKQKESNSKR
jgi:isochorismate pyruvate lyase